MTRLFLILGLMILGCAAAAAAPKLERDVFPTAQGELAITFIGHASLMFEFAGKTIHIDPTAQEGDYTVLPKADLVLVTHEHGDHLDPSALSLIHKDGSLVLVSRSCAGKIPGAIVMSNGDEKTFQGTTVEAVPAYNIVHKRQNGQPFHPKGNGNGYVITFGDKKIYVAGDTEDIPEMKALTGIDIAFLPMNVPYTMTPEMVAHAAGLFSPKILYPYHYGETDTAKLRKLLAGETGIEVRVRNMR